MLEILGDMIVSVLEGALDAILLGGMLYYIFKFIKFLRLKYDKLYKSTKKPRNR